MDFRPEHYFESALERREEARAALRRKDYGLAMWIAGVGVECLLRAYRTSIDPEFDARHDIVRLLRESRVLPLIESWSRSQGRSDEQVLAEIQRFRADINAVDRLWHNNYRYASSNRLRAYLRTKQVCVGVKGDCLKEMARRLTEAAARIIDVGERLWGSSARNS